MDAINGLFVAIVIVSIQPKISAAPENFRHTKATYSVRAVCKILGVHEKTLRRWMKEGVRTPDGRITRLRFVQLSERKTRIEKDEVERFYRERGEVSDSLAEVIPFPDDDERDIRAASRAQREELRKGHPIIGKPVGTDVVFCSREHYVASVDRR